MPPCHIRLIYIAPLSVPQPGDQSSLRHWHTLSDEFIYAISGELVLCTDDGEFILHPGMCIGFKANERNAHHLINRSSEEAKFIVIGTRTPGDTAFYPDDNMAWLDTPEKRVAIHKSGELY